ncbi:MAG TPA: hypothetical protein VGS20_07865 [Candidatus Acidoferrales bacterium]|nr:hypothetical protein [Candidatus Acidoferrales bacterium]
MLKRRRTRRWIPVFAAFASALGGIPARAQTPKPVTGTSRTPAQQLADSRRVWLPVFAIRSGFWVNLHHFLYLQARLQQGLPTTGGGAQGATASPAADLSKLATGERAAWQDAVDYYATHFAGYDMKFDSFLVRVDDQLGRMADCPDLSGRSAPRCDAGLAPDLTAVLEEAAPVYRAHWWPAHDRSNQAWIAQAQPLVRDYGGKLAEMLARIYGVGWPADPIPIDVVNSVGQYGAYTTLDPVHVILAGADPRNQGPAALEVIFQEASQALATGVEQAIIDQFHSRTKPIPRDLWPALVSYTARVAVSRVFAGQPAGAGAEATPAGAAGGRQDFQRLLERYWQPYLDGKTDSATAIARLVNAM